MSQLGLKHKFVWNVTDFETLDPENDDYDHVLGLMSHGHMEFEPERRSRNPIEEPSLIEMTTKAIKILSKNPKGFFLLVEGGRIDHGHHGSNAQRALDEFVTFDEAIGQALRLTNEEETQLTVTADHSHVFTMGGYSFRGNAIFGISLSSSQNLTSQENTTFTSLLYANGPGGLKEIRKTNLTNEQTGILQTLSIV